MKRSSCHGPGDLGLIDWLSIKSALQHSLQWKLSENKRKLFILTSLLFPKILMTCLRSQEQNNECDKLFSWPHWPWLTDDRWEVRGQNPGPKKRSGWALGTDEKAKSRLPKSQSGLKRVIWCRRAGSYTLHRVDGQPNMMSSKPETTWNKLCIDIFHVIWIFWHPYED